MSVPKKGSERGLHLLVGPESARRHEGPVDDHRRAGNGDGAAENPREQPGRRANYLPRSVVLLLDPVRDDIELLGRADDDDR